VTRNEAIERLEAILAAAKSLPEDVRILGCYIGWSNSKPGLHIPLGTLPVVREVTVGNWTHLYADDREGVEVYSVEPMEAE
jgi:hypothetical protein